MGQLRMRLGHLQMVIDEKVVPAMGYFGTVATREKDYLECIIKKVPSHEPEALIYMSLIGAS